MTRPDEPSARKLETNQPRLEHPPAGDLPMLYCPVCNERLAQSRCKLVCAKCGYFMSCADYY